MTFDNSDILQLIIWRNCFVIFFLYLQKKDTQLLILVTSRNFILCAKFWLTNDSQQMILIWNFLWQVLNSYR